MRARARRYVQCLSSSVIGLVVSILDRYHIWCILMGLFMSPITSQSSASYRTRRLGGYRLLDLAVIGAIVICLFVIGLAGAMVIRPIEVSKISENITGRDGTQPSQVTGQPTDFTKNYSDYYPGLIGLRRMSLTRAPMPGQDPGRD